MCWFFSIKYLSLMLLLLAITSIFIGAYDLNLIDLISNLNTEKTEILFISRLPRLISILVVGASMSVCGVVMQQLTANRFVSPSVSGVSDWAKLGILISILIYPDASMMFKTFIAFIFAVLGSVMFIKIVHNLKLKDLIFIPLVGIMIGGVVSSITIFFAYQYDLIQNLESWLQGSFALILKGRYELLYLSIPTLILIYTYATKLTIVSLGNSIAKSLGINYSYVVSFGLILVAFITATTITTVGVIPFVGVIVPNIIALKFGDNLHNSLPVIALFGAFYVLICDIFSRIIIYPYEVPISISSGIIGALTFLYLIIKEQNK